MAKQTGGATKAPPRKAAPRATNERPATPVEEVVVVGEDYVDTSTGEVIGELPTAVTRYAPTEFGPLTVEQAVTRYNALAGFVRAVLKKDTDFGAIPGTGGKATLLKPGAEKLATFFGLAAELTPLQQVEEWSAAEPFFFYRYRCSLYRNGVLVAATTASANSHESKYRWREAKRVCPGCGQAAIIVGKSEYGGGFVCFKKQGGCGAKYREDDQRIIGQPAGRVPNPDIADAVNTLEKMAQKRALIGSVLIATGASEYFTQDLEDLHYEDATTQQQTTTQQQQQQTRLDAGNDANGRPVARSSESSDSRVVQSAENAPRVTQDVSSVDSASTSDHLFALRDAMLERAVSKPAKAPPTLAVRARMTLDKVCDNDERMRHVVTDFLFGKQSTNDLTVGEAEQVVKWVALDAQNQPAATAAAEAAAIWDISTYKQA